MEIETSSERLLYEKNASVEILQSSDAIARVLRQCQGQAQCSTTFRSMLQSRSTRPTNFRCRIQNIDRWQHNEKVLLKIYKS